MTPARRADSRDPGAAHDLGSELGLIAEMAQEFAVSRDIGATLRKAVARITQQVGAEGGALFLLDEADPEELVCEACCGPVEISGIRLKISEGVIGRCVRRNAPEMVRDVLNDPNFEQTVDADTGFTTRSILCAPLSVPGRCLGAIELVNKTSGDQLFDPHDLQLLRAMAASAALALLNARLTADLMEQERDRRELELAAEIQRSLLPRAQPSPFPVAGLNIPARRVSGDFYDFLTLDDGRIRFAVGDVSGKGMNAALLMAKTSSLFRCLAKSATEPGRLLDTINREICETATRGMFVTMLVGTYDATTGSVCIANAGHEPPLLHRPDGSFEAIEADAPPVGILAPPDVRESVYPQRELRLGDGTLYVFTDGVTEALLDDGRRLGVDGLKELIEKSAHRSLQERLDTIASHLVRDRLHDDLTLLAVAGAPDPGEELLRHRFSARAEELKTVRALVQQAAERGGASPTCSRDVVMAVDEACQNIIRHAYGGTGSGDIVLAVERVGEQLVVWLRDFAPKIDERRVEPRDLDDLRPGGLGVHLIRTVMDECGFAPSETETGNLFRMAKRIG